MESPLWQPGFVFSTKVDGEIAPPSLLPDGNGMTWQNVQCSS